MSIFKKHTVIFLVIFLLSQPSFGQADIISPETPLFTSITINQTSGNTEMTWTPSSSTDVAGYIIYLYKNNEGFSVDTIFDPAATSFSVYRPKSVYESEAFVVAAIDYSENVSPLSNSLHTIFIETRIDTCNKRINLMWNRYSSYPSKVIGYDIYTSENGGPYNLSGSVSEEFNEYVINEFTNDSQYCFVIKARLENSNISSSNKSCLKVNMQEPAKWINADYATVTRYSNISLAFTVDPSSETDLYSLERKTGPSGSFQHLSQIRDTSGFVTFIDESADIAKTNYYRLTAVNNCNVAGVTSNIASNIVLEAKESENEILLRWNKYRGWLGSVASYRLFIDTGSGFSEKAEIEASDSVYTISVPDLMYNRYGEDVCFYVTATETANPHDIIGESRSNTACFAIDDIITVPDVFTPDGNLKNDLFKPFLTFTPEKYHLVVTNRQGKKLFETDDFNESWDGTDNGSPVPDGVYLWYLKVAATSGKAITRTGTITVFKNR